LKQNVVSVSSGWETEIRNPPEEADLF